MNCLQCKYATNFQPGRIKVDMGGVVRESAIMAFACTLNCCWDLSPIVYIFTHPCDYFEPRKG